jgi:bla regulator protein blaR1
VNVPYGPEDTFTDTGGVFRAVNWPLVRLISFAYKTTTGQRDTFQATLPGWAVHDGFDIEARSEDPKATKDQMRLMVRSMLEERFHFKAHFETRMLPMYAVELIQPGTLGPQLRPHPSDDSCSGTNAAITLRSAAGEERDASTAPANTASTGYSVLPGGFPFRCGTFVNMPASQPYLRHEGGRNLTMAQIVSTFTGMGHLPRPAVDRTGLAGTYDWVMEFIDEREGHTPPPDAEGLTFAQALAKQNGLKLVSGKAPLQVFVVDHLERPTEN